MNATNPRNHSFDESNRQGEESHLPAGEPGSMLTDVPLRTGLTPAVIAGRWIDALLSWGSVALLVALGVVAAVRRRGHAKTPTP